MNTEAFSWSANYFCRFKSIQDDCRNQCALIWQIYLAITSPSQVSPPLLPPQAPTSPTMSETPTSPHSSHSSSSYSNLSTMIAKAQNSTSSSTKSLHVRVAGVMIERNPESLELILRYTNTLVQILMYTRIFPSELFEIIKISSPELVAESSDKKKRRPSLYVSLSTRTMSNFISQPSWGIVLVSTFWSGTTEFPAAYAGLEWWNAPRTL